MELERHAFGFHRLSGGIGSTDIWLRRSTGATARTESAAQHRHA
jgi:hypothetical protein